MAKEIGVREFRENLARILESDQPVAITRHGETIGIYVPTHRRPTEADVAALKAAVQKVHEAMGAVGVTEDDLMADLEEMEEARRRARRKARIRCRRTPARAACQLLPTQGTRGSACLHLLHVRS